MVRACWIAIKRDWHWYFGLVWTKFGGNSCLGPISKSSVYIIEDNSNPDSSTRPYCDGPPMQNGPGIKNLFEREWGSCFYRGQLKPGQFHTTLLCRMVRPCRMVRASKIVFEREWGSCFGLFWTKLDTNSYLGPILKGTMANNHGNPNPDVSA